MDRLGVGKKDLFLEYGNSYVIRNILFVYFIYVLCYKDILRFWKKF